MKTLDEALKSLVLFYSEIPIANIGDIVTTQLPGWKRPHDVKITNITADLVILKQNWAEHQENPVWMGVEHSYFGAIINFTGNQKKHPSYLLWSFKTKTGKEWHLKHEHFNHVGLCFNLPEAQNERT
jgi:hypothetical protein